MVSDCHLKSTFLESDMVQTDNFISSGPTLIAVRLQYLLTISHTLFLDSLGAPPSFDNTS